MKNKVSPAFLASLLTLLLGCVLAGVIGQLFVLFLTAMFASVIYAIWSLRE